MVKPQMPNHNYCKTLNFGGSSYYIYFGALNFGVYACWTKYHTKIAWDFDYSRCVIFAMLPRSQNLQNKGHKKYGFYSMCLPSQNNYPLPRLLNQNIGEQWFK